MHKSQRDANKNFLSELMGLAALVLPLVGILTWLVTYFFGWTCTGIVGILLAGVGSLVGLVGTISGATRSREVAFNRASDVRDLKEVRGELRTLTPKWEVRDSESPGQRSILEDRKEALTEKQWSLEDELLGSDDRFEVFYQMTRPLVPWVMALCLIAGGLFMRLASLIALSSKT